VNLVDTSAWIEYFFGGPNAAYFAGPIEDTGHLIVPVVCLYEVFKKVNQVADEARAFRSVAQMKQGRVVDLSEEIALSAATISLRHRLPMADSFIYATAQFVRAVVWTQDEHFKNLAAVNYREARTRAS
jgi:predicted nucleic acid-binding protein